MVLTLYHDNKEPYKVYNTIKLTVDNFRTVTVDVKSGGDIQRRQFMHDEHYQRFTVQLD